MANLTLHLELEGGRSEWAPGGSVTGTARITADESWEARYAELELGWHTEGFGDEDSEAVEMVPLADAGETIPARFERAFALPIPVMPHSYEGRHLQIHWSVVLRARPRRGRPVEVELPVVVKPEGAREAPTGSVAVPDLPPPE
jgi:hypothetical protein